MLARGHRSTDSACLVELGGIGLARELSKYFQVRVLNPRFPHSPCDVLIAVQVPGSADVRGRREGNLLPMTATSIRSPSNMTRPC